MIKKRKNVAKCSLTVKKEVYYHIIKYFYFKELDSIYILYIIR